MLQSCFENCVRLPPAIESRTTFKSQNSETVNGAEASAFRCQFWCQLVLRFRSPLCTSLR
jgi:hypothetical protein